jgi:hypothetical protein
MRQIFPHVHQLRHRYTCLPSIIGPASISAAILVQALATSALRIRITHFFELTQRRIPRRRPSRRQLRVRWRRRDWRGSHVRLDSSYQNSASTASVTINNRWLMLHRPLGCVGPRAPIWQGWRRLCWPRYSFAYGHWRRRYLSRAPFRSVKQLGLDGGRRRRMGVF